MQGGVRADHGLIQSSAHRTAFGERFGPSPTPVAEPVPQFTNGGDGRGHLDHLAIAGQGLSQRGKEKQLKLQSTSQGRKRTVSPRRIGAPGGLSTRPSAQTVEVRTAEP